MASNDDPPNLGKPQFASHAWFEPTIVVSIMVASLIVNRRRDFAIFRRRRSKGYSPLPTDDGLPLAPGAGYMPKRRDCCFTVISTPNSSKFANNFHSRILQKYPFLVEMFYWALNYVVYSVTKVWTANVYGGDTEVTWLAQDHGIDILRLEHSSAWSIFFPLREVDVQGFFLLHPTLLTIANRSYSLVHIPGTVAFLSWYYYAAPNHAAFAVVRRTMTLANFVAFFVFCFYPCMPPRLLPESFHFHDTVRQGNAESVWAGGKNVNQLAAMPSLHFTYAFIVGCTFLYHSGALQLLSRGGGHGKLRKPIWATMVSVVAGVGYPLLVLTVIVATANHYFLDALVATLTVALSFYCNRVWEVLLPAEDVLLYVLRLEKPVPTTGDRLCY